MRWLMSTCYPSATLAAATESPGRRRTCSIRAITAHCSTGLILPSGDLAHRAAAPLQQLRSSSTQTLMQESWSRSRHSPP